MLVPALRTVDGLAKAHVPATDEGVTFKILLLPLSVRYRLSLESTATAYGKLKYGTILLSASKIAEATLPTSVLT